MVDVIGTFLALRNPHHLPRGNLPAEPSRASWFCRNLAVIAAVLVLAVRFHCSQCALARTGHVDSIRVPVVMTQRWTIPLRAKVEISSGKKGEAPATSFLMGLGQLAAGGS